jgi:hypothetical protein
MASSTTSHRNLRLAGALASATLLLATLTTGCPFKEETFERHCISAADCSDGNPCTQDLCTAGTCSNPVEAKETACKTGVCDGEGKCVECLSYADCANAHPITPICDARTQTCVSCSDGKKDGKETGVDCGGPDCGACQAEPCDPMHGCGDMTVCAEPEDVCCNTSCGATCQSCTQKNGSAADGTCSAVPVGKDPFNQCSMTGTGSAGGCGATMERCACEDGVKNQNETDIDCGGDACPGCGGGKQCNTFSDCAAEVPGETPECINGACCESLCNQSCRMCNPTGQCVSVPAGATDPNMICTSNQACGAGTTGCVAKAGAACNPAVGGADCLSGSCSAAKKTCNPGASGKPCNGNADCTSGTCQNNACM